MRLPSGPMCRHRRRLYTLGSGRADWFCAARPTTATTTAKTAPVNFGISPRIFLFFIQGHEPDVGFCDSPRKVRALAVRGHLHRPDDVALRRERLVSRFRSRVDDKHVLAT